ncbi:MAG: 50S ribosomal protein L29 [Actinomycetota bacterium]
MSIKTDEYRSLSSGELEEKLEEVQEEFFNLRFQNATGQLENYAQLGKAKQDIARLRTILRERDLGIEREVTETKPAKRRKKKTKADKADESGASNG